MPLGLLRFDRGRHVEDCVFEYDEESEDEEGG